jgi:RsiW-degrading membrane proteinase PrsW (M82 family)
MEQEEFEALTTDDAFRKAVLSAFAEMRAQFSAMNTRLSNQDVAIAQNTELTKRVSDETRGVREFMKDGASAAQLFCRMAAAWRFMWKWVIVAIGGPSIFLYSLFYYAVHGHFPPWFTAVASFFIR